MFEDIKVVWSIPHRHLWLLMSCDHIIKSLQIWQVILANMSKCFFSYSLAVWYLLIAGKRCFQHYWKADYFPIASDSTASLRETLFQDFYCPLGGNCDCHVPVSDILSTFSVYISLWAASYETWAKQSQNRLISPGSVSNYQSNKSLLYDAEQSF